MNETNIVAEPVSITLSTLKLIKLREGKGQGMLTEEEIALLRESKKEIAEACRQARMASEKRKNGLC